jgi:glycosyltransferase involved in cell wall biosynthesis
VDDADRPSLTAGAAVFVYPSFYEGFGFPVAQAMACGVPVITSAVSSLPEILGEGGVLVDPASTADLSAALSRLLTSASERSRLGSLGRARAERCYRWERCARQTWSFFERACS